MTAKERILAKPKSVQTVLKCWIVKASLEHSEALLPSQMEHYSELALEWWKLVLYMHGANRLESQIAEMVVERLNKQETWGRILAGERDDTTT